MKKILYGFSAAAAALLIAGCGAGTSDTSSATDITVERGPLLYAAVTDADGQKAVMQGYGVYRFAQPPVYPVTSYGGVIDMNHNNIIDEGDLIATQLKLQTSQGDAATIVTTLAANTEIKTMLQNDFNLSESQMFNETPSSDKMIAAISDEVYKYSVENNISDPAQLTLQEMKSIKAQIEVRIAHYENSTQDAAGLEQELVQNELRIQVMTQTEAQNVEAQMQASNGGQSSSAHNGNGGMDHGQNGTCDNNCSSSAQSSSEAAQSSSSAAAELTDAQKYVLAYMWNEEKLAKELYLALNDVWPNMVLYNIPTRAETQHQAAVEALIESYDINITNLEDFETGYSQAQLQVFGPGEYSIAEVQELYDTLYAKGVQSAQDALEVGCMVEVTDVNDLNEDIITAEGADDMVATLENLRSGSYNHYWAFDNALKMMGVSDGCCILGDAFCKTPEEYPASNGGMGGH